MHFTLICFVTFIHLEVTLCLWIIGRS